MCTFDICNTNQNEKLTEIANYIQNIRSRAKALQHEAARMLEEAKREVEKMILGE